MTDLWADKEKTPENHGGGGQLPPLLMTIPEINDDNDDGYRSISTSRPKDNEIIIKCGVQSGAENICTTLFSHNVCYLILSSV